MNTKDNNDCGTPNGIQLNKQCVLNQLSVDEQEQLFDWLECYPAKRVLELVAAPPPEGFGIKTHLTTLRRFHLRARANFQSQLAKELPSPAEPAMSNNPVAFQALQRAAAELSTDQLTPARFTAAARWILRLKEIEQRQEELDLNNKRLILERDKFEYNAARATLIYQNELKSILQNDTTDDEDKVNAAREKIFGPRSNLIEPKP